uniref:exodeoxyribonuclease III n=1 Tax=Spermophilus dauricus TaxID=99837 RepID=A0A8C9PEU7_SPEDA
MKLKVKGWEKIYHAHGPRKQAGVAILISNKIDFKTKLIKRDKEGHYILLKGTIHQQDITIINIYAPNNGAATFIKQILLKFKNQIDHNTIIMGDFNTPLSPLDRSSKQNKKICWFLPSVGSLSEKKNLLRICTIGLTL